MEICDHNMLSTVLFIPLPYSLALKLINCILLLLLLLLLLLTANVFVPGGSVLQCKGGQNNAVKFNTIQ